MRLQTVTNATVADVLVYIVKYVSIQNDSNIIIDWYCAIGEVPSISPKYAVAQVHETAVLLFKAQVN